jgi:hypothetical protein
MDKPFYPPLRGSPITVKSVFASKTAIGIVLALAAKVFGVAGDDLNNVATHALALWPILVGVLADVGALIARLRLTQFDRSILSRPDFYLQIVSGIATVAAAFGYDLSALQGILAKGIDAWPAIVALAGGLIGIFGSLTAKDKLKISVPKTRILPLLILGAVSLSMPAFAVEGRAMGWVQDKAGVRDRSYSAVKNLRAAKIAVSSDLSRKMPDIYDQGTLGSCTGQGIAAILDYARTLQAKRFVHPSRLFIYYCERVLEGTVRQDAGAQIRSGIEVVTDLGACRERLWPYLITRFAVTPPSKCYVDALNYQALNGYKLDHTDGRSIRIALSDGLPVVFGCLLYSGIDRITYGRSTLEMPKRGERTQGGHCMVIVGHDDRTRLYKVRNSWGIGWGRNGHLSMPYDYVHSAKLSGDFWVIDKAE